MGEAANVGQLHDNRVAHQDRRDEGAVRLVERVVERSEVKHHADRPTLDLREHTALLDELVAALKHALVRLDQVGDEVHSAIELLGRIGLGLADFPHEDVDDLVTQRLELGNELLDLGDAVRRRRLRPLAAAHVPALGSRIERSQRVLLRKPSLVPNEDLLLGAGLRGERERGFAQRQDK